MLLSISVSIHLLNCRGFDVLRLSLGFAVKPALFNSSSLSTANLLFNKLRVSFIYIAIMLSRSLLVEIRRQGSYVDSSINSFSF